MGNSVYHSVLEMDALGHENVVFTPAYDFSLPRREDFGEHSSIVRLRPLFSFGNAAILPELMWCLRDFDIIHFHYPFYGSVEPAIVGWFFSRARFMIHYHMDNVGSGFKGLIFRLYTFFMLPLVVRLAKVITCASIDYVKSSALRYYFQGHKHKFIQIPFGVDTERFIPKETLAQERVLFVGGLDRQHYFKGVDHLIDAFALVAKEFPNAQLRIIGKGDLEEYYRKRIAACGLESRASISNSISDEALLEEYTSAAVTVLPSINRGEAFGLVLLESLASGTPVIASNLPGVRNVFHNNEHGYLFHSGDIEDLSSKLGLILSDVKAAALMGKAGRAWVETEYSWKLFSQRLEAAYYRVLYAPGVVRKEESQ